MDAVTIACSSCGEAAPPGATWCEACGHELATEPRPACVSCGEREVDADEGYCLSCGYRQPRDRDHLVVGEGPVVAISDRGRRHHHNEDAVAIGLAGGWAGAIGDGTAGEGPAGDAVVDLATHLVVVVCDGVSSTPGSAEASAAAAAAARDHLVAELSARSSGTTGFDVPGLLAEAVAAAQDAAAASPEPDGAPSVDGPPSSTLVAVVVRPDRRSDGPGVELVTAWVGDSRAYWVGDGGQRRLTGPDHELDGSLTRWLGADSVEPIPDIETVTALEPGHLVVCTDGLWRYVAEAGELAGLIERLTIEGKQGPGLAESLVDHANEQGGHDNITVALWSNRPGWPRDNHTGPSAPIASVAMSAKKQTTTEQTTTEQTTTEQTR